MREALAEAVRSGADCAYHCDLHVWCALPAQRLPIRFSRRVASALLLCATSPMPAHRQVQQMLSLTHFPLSSACFLAPTAPVGNAALAQAMCGAVVDVAAMLVALPAQGAAAAGAGGAAGSNLPPHPAAAGQQEQAAAAAAQQLLLPYPAALRHNDCHFVYQASEHAHSVSCYQVCCHCQVQAMPLLRRSYASSMPA